MQRSISRISGPGEHTSLQIHRSDCCGALTLQGAHVIDWTPAGQQPVIWMSQSSALAPGRPIRGGVPICFPWFAAHPHDPQLPLHGTVRLQDWTVAEQQEDAEGTTILLQTLCDPFALSYRVRFAHTLCLELTVELTETAAEPAEFESALHTYFAVGDIREVQVQGLEQAMYHDKVSGVRDCAAADAPIHFAAETDRIYVETQSDITVHDPVLGRRIRILREGSDSAVVWNPWIRKSAQMADFGDEEWRGMLCIEAANVDRNRILLQPVQSQTMRVRIAVEQ